MTKCKGNSVEGKAVFLTNDVGSTRYPHAKKMKFDPHLASHTRINSKCSMNLGGKPKTIKLLEENIGENLCDLEISKDFLAMTPIP